MNKHELESQDCSGFGRPTDSDWRTLTTVHIRDVARKFQNDSTTEGDANEEKKRNKGPNQSDAADNQTSKFTVKGTRPLDIMNKQEVESQDCSGFVRTSDWSTLADVHIRDIANGRIKKPF